MAGSLSSSRQPISQYRLITNKSDCNCCRPNVGKGLCVLISLWLLTMIVLAIYTDRFHDIGVHHNQNGNHRQNLKLTSVLNNNNNNNKNNNDHHIDKLITEQKSSSSSTPLQQQQSTEKLNCFAVVVSNEEYIDGTLILGYSLRKNSKLAQTGKAELVVIVPEKALSKDTMERLLLAGWDHVLEVEDLAKKAPKAHWAGTFNKLHLFNLTQYSLVAFFDADMLMQHNPDYIFRTHLKDYQHIGALGNSLHDRNGNARAPYFQTGMMLLIPHQKAFDAMMDDFYHGKDSRGLNGRDGLIIRRYFGANYKNLDDALSAHVATQVDYDWVTGLHYRGSFKPWFNRKKAPAFDADDVHRKKKEGKTDFGRAGKWLEIGPAYSAWWETYEEFHRTKMMQRDLDLPDKSDFPEGYDPKIHVWMNRHSKKKSYIQLLRVEEMKEREKVIDAEIAAMMSKSKNNQSMIITVVVSETGASCDAACSKEGRICKDSILASRKYVQSCAAINKHLENICGGRCLGGRRQPKSNTNNDDDDELKENDFSFYIDQIPRGGKMEAFPSQPDSISCAYNSFLDPFVVPLCNATATVNGKRICACVDTSASTSSSSNSGNDSKNQDHQNEDKPNHHQNNNNKEDAPASSENENENDAGHELRDSKKFNAEESCQVVHPATVKKTCIIKLADSKSTGHWSIYYNDKGIFPDEELNHDQNSKNSNDGEGGGDEQDEENKHRRRRHHRHNKQHDNNKNNKNNKKKHNNKNSKSNNKLVPVLTRHHDGFVGTIWFPQKSSPFTIEKILLSHLVGRILGFEWVPPTILQLFPMKTTPKNLIKRLKLHDRHHHHDKKKQEEENVDDDDENEKSYEEKLVSDTIDYLAPGDCPDLVSFVSGEESSALDDLQIKSVVSFHHQHQNHKDKTSVSSSSSIVNWQTSTGFAEASLFKFILGVNHHNADNSHDLTWEELMEHVDELSAKNMHEFAHEIPRCSTLEGIEQNKRTELFSSVNDDNHHHKNRIQILEEVVKLLHSTFDGDDADNNKKTSFTELLTSAGIDSIAWGFISDERNNGSRNKKGLDLFDVLSFGSSTNNNKNNKNNIHPKKDFGIILDHLQKRVEALQPLTSRCKLL